MATNYNEFITALSNITGLNTDVVAAWVKREQGAYNNPLGLTYTSTSSGVPVGKWIASNRYLGAFPSQTAAAQATAQRLNQAQYAGIRSAARTGTSEQQALAISRSPWRLGQSGLQSLWQNPESWMRNYPRGTDPYYYKGFVEAGILGYVTNPQGGASTPITPTPSENPPANQGSAGTLADFQARLREIGISDDPNHIISDTEAMDIATKLYKVSGYIAEGIAATYANKTVSSAFAQGSIDISPNYNPFDPNNDLPIPDLEAAVVFIGVILVGITFMLIGGFITLRTRK